MGMPTWTPSGGMAADRLCDGADEMPSLFSADKGRLPSCKLFAHVENMMFMRFMILRRSMRQQASSERKTALALVDKSKSAHLASMQCKPCRKRVCDICQREKASRSTVPVLQITLSEQKAIALALACAAQEPTLSAKLYKHR
jgi:hypothetical protein